MVIKIPRIFSLFNRENRTCQATNLKLRKEDNLKLKFPTRSTLILGGSGCGKTTLLENIAFQAIKKQEAGFFYGMSEYNNTLNQLHKYYSIEKSTQSNFNLNFKIIDLEDITKTERVNLLSKKYFDERADSLLLTQIITESIIRNSLCFYKRGGLFYKKFEMIEAYAEIWIVCVMERLIKESNSTELYSIPHAISIILDTEPHRILKWLCADSRIKALLSPIVNIALNDENAFNCISNLARDFVLPMQNSNNYWILSGDDLALDISNIENPTFLYVNSHPLKDKGEASTISSIIEVVMSEMNKSNRKESVFLLDESGSIVLSGLYKFLVTLKKRKISSYISCHTTEQLIAYQDYTSILHVFENKIFGKFFNFNDVTRKMNFTYEDSIKLNQGEFYFSVPATSGDNIKRENGLFSLKNIKPELNQNIISFPGTKNVTQQDVVANFERINIEAKAIIDNFYFSKRY